MTNKIFIIESKKALTTERFHIQRKEKAEWFANRFEQDRVLQAK